MLRLENLNSRTRQLMSKEIDQDIIDGRLYINRFLSETGRRDYPRLLKEAAEEHNEVWLAFSLLDGGRVLRAQAVRNGVKSAISEEEVRVFADMAFNRYYCRAVCGLAIECGVSVSIYRADEDPRAPQEAIGWEMERHDPGPFRELLRSQPTLEAALNLPGGPRSGLSLFFFDPSTDND